MAGIIRSIINLTRWRGSEPNVLQSGRVDAHVGNVATGTIGFTVQRGSVDLPNQTSSVNVTITSVDTSKAFVIAYGLEAGRAVVVSARIVNSRTLQFRVDSDDSTVYYQVIESY